MYSTYTTDIAVPVQRAREIPSRDARKQQREILEGVKTDGRDIAITQYGEPVGVLIPVADYEATRQELEDPRLRRFAEES